MNSNLELASRMLNDFITSGDPAALAAVCDLVEETSPEQAEAIRGQAAGRRGGSADGLFWNDDALDLVYAVLGALGASGAEKDAAVKAAYSGVSLDVA